MKSNGFGLKKLFSPSYELISVDMTNIWLEQWSHPPCLISTCSVPHRTTNDIILCFSINIGLLFKIDKDEALFLTLLSSNN